jgi:hypothetical protein
MLALACCRVRWLHDLAGVQHRCKSLAKPDQAPAKDCAIVAPAVLKLAGAGWLIHLLRENNKPPVASKQSDGAVVSS